MPINIPNNSAFVVRHQEAFVDLDNQVAAEGKRLVVTSNGRELKILPQRSKVSEFFADLFGISTKEIKNLRNYLASLPSQESLESQLVSQAFRKEIGDAYAHFQEGNEIRTEENKGQHIYGESNPELAGQQDSKTQGTAAYVILNSGEAKQLNRQDDQSRLIKRDQNLQDFASGVKKTPEELDALHQAHRAQRKEGQSLIGREGGLGASKAAIINTLKEDIKKSSKAVQKEVYGSDKYDPIDRIGELRKPLAGIAEGDEDEDVPSEPATQNVVKTVESKSAQVATPQMDQHVEAKETIAQEETPIAPVGVQAASVKDTQEFKDRVAVLQGLFDPRDLDDHEAFIEARMTTQEGPMAKTLSDAQYFAIKSYSDSAYTDMNAALRNPSGPEAADPKVQQLNAYATSGLKQLAEGGFNFSGITNRGVVNYDYFIHLLPNQTYTASAFTSTSTKASMAHTMALANDAMGRDSTVIHTYGKTGVDIAALSNFKSEAEILYPPGSEFRVLFTGEHLADVRARNAGDPPAKKKVTYLVVEERSVSEKSGVSGIVSALDLAAPRAGVVKPKAKAPLSQAQAVGPLVGGDQADNDDDDAPPVDIDTFGRT
jgi:hypothetical protein